MSRSVRDHILEISNERLKTHINININIIAIILITHIVSTEKRSQNTCLAFDRQNISFKTDIANLLLLNTNIQASQYTGLHQPRGIDVTSLSQSQNSAHCSSSTRTETHW